MLIWRRPLRLTGPFEDEQIGLDVDWRPDLDVFEHVRIRTVPDIVQQSRRQRGPPSMRVLPLRKHVVALENIQHAIREYLVALDDLVKGQDVREVTV